jgi:hypothetical protein
LHFSDRQFTLTLNFGPDGEMPSDRKFEPPMPAVPGVPSGKRHRQKPFDSRQRTMPPAVWSALVVVVLILVMAAVLWRGFRAAARGEAALSVTNDGLALPPAAPVVEMPVGPGQIATASELAAPWSSKRFLFHDAQTGERTPALAVRLPGGELWGISLRTPFGTCELEYVTNLAELGSKHHIFAQHPMVVDACTDTIYDLAQFASGPNGLVRGEIVRGKAVRPPIAIEVVERENRVIAVRSE